MVKGTRGLILLAGCLLGGAFASTYPIGVVNTKTIMQSSSRIKVESQKLKKKFDKQSAQLTRERKTLVSDIQKFRKNSTVMSSKKRKRLEQKIMKREQALSQRQVTFSRRVMAAQQKIMQHVRSDFEDIAKKIALEKKLALVLDQDGGVLYVNPENNLTKMVKRKFN